MSPEIVTPPGDRPDLRNPERAVVQAASVQPLWRRSRMAVLLSATTAIAVVYAFQSWSARSGNGRLETACASILNVLNPEGSTFEQLGSNLSAGGLVARMLYTVTTAEGRSKRAIILCAFDGNSSFAASPKLVAVSVNGQQLGAARLTFLNRFWLPSEQASAGLPENGPASPAQSQTTEKRTSG